MCSKSADGHADIVPGERHTLPYQDSTLGQLLVSTWRQVFRPFPIRARPRQAHHEVSLCALDEEMTACVGAVTLCDEAACPSSHGQMVLDPLPSRFEGVA